MNPPSASRGLCIVLDGVSAADVQAALGDCDGLDIILLEPTVDLDRLIASRRDSLRPIDYPALLSEQLPSLRDAFVRFIAEWPVRYRVNGETFRAWLRRDAGSLWWLLEPSQRNPESSPVFAAFCLASVVKDRVRSGDYSRVVILGGGEAFAATIETACASERIAVVRRTTRRDSLNSVAALLVQRLRSGVALALKRFVASRFDRPPAPRTGGLVVAFHTWCPHLWLADRPVDRCFLELPDRVQALGVSTIYACALSGVEPGALGRAVAAVRRMPASVRGRMAWLERFISWPRLATVFFDVRLWLRFERLLRGDATLRQSCVAPGDIDLSRLVLREIRYAMAVQLPVLLVLAIQAEGFVRCYAVTRFVITLETYCYGRALLWGIRRAGIGTRVFGLQHSPVNRNQLFYRFLPEELASEDPVLIPDDFLLHSRLAAEELERAGVPRERLHITGAPKFMSIEEHRMLRRSAQDEVRRQLGLPANERIILVAGTIWPNETERLFAYTFEASAGQDLLLVFKGHPVVNRIPDLLPALHAAYPSVRFVQSTTALQRLQSVASVMVVGNSTSDVEALAIGCPVIRVRASALNASPTSDIPGTVLDVNNVVELRAALVSGVGLPDTDVVDAALGPMDAGVYDRVTALLVEDGDWSVRHPPHECETALR